MPRPPFPADANLASSFWNAPIGLFEADPQGQCVRVNRRWTEISGLSHDQALGDGWIAAIHPEDRLRVFSDWEAAARREDEFVLDYRMQRPDGTVVPIHGRATGLYDANGALTGFTGIAIEQEIRAAAENLPAPVPGLGDAIFDHAPVGLQIFNSRGISLRVNETQRRQLGMASVTTGVGQFNVLTDPFTAGTSLAKAIAHTLATGEPVETPAELVDYSAAAHWELSSAPRYVERSTFPLALENGEMAVALVARDVSEDVRAHHALRDAEKRFRQVFEAAGDGIVLVGTDYRAVLANPAFAAMVRAPESGLEGLDMLALFATEDDMFAVGTDLATSNKSVRNILARRLDGSEFHAATHFSNLFDDDGEPAGVLVVARDITDRIASRRAVEDSEQRLRNVIDALRTMVYAFDECEDGVLRASLCNSTLLRRLRLDFEDWVNTTPEDVLGEEWGSALRAQLTESLRTGRLVERIRTREVDNKTLTFHTRAIPTIDPATGRARVIVETRDVTIERENSRLAEDHARLVSLSTLAAGVAHDFNNLLHSILLGTDLATEASAANWVGLEILADVRNSALRAAELATKMLALAGQAPLYPVDVSLERLADGLRAAVRDAIPAGTTLTIDLRTPDAVISGDDSQVLRALSSIVTNAVEAGPSATEVRVTFSTTRPTPVEAARAYPPGAIVAQEYACIEVRDTGHGMDAATVARIFEPFFSTRFAGRGLGLSAALGVVRGHGGGIIVDSEVGAGTRMRILLPLANELEDEAAA